MLRQPLPSSMRRAGGRALVIAILLATGYAAWASQPATPATVPAGRIAADIVLRVDEGTPTKVRILTSPGELFRVRSGEGDAQVAIEGTVTRATHEGQPALALDLRVIEGDGESGRPQLVKEVSSPKILLRNGKPGSIHMGRELRGEDGRLAFKGVRLAVTLTDSMAQSPAPARTTTRSARPEVQPAKQAIASRANQWSSYEQLAGSLSASWEPPKPAEDGC